MRNYPRRDDRQGQERHPLVTRNPIQSSRSQIRKKSLISTSFARIRKSSSMYSSATYLQSIDE